MTVLPVDQRPFLFTDELAAYLGVSTDTIERMIKAGKFPHSYQLAPRGPRRFPKCDIPGLEEYDPAVAYEGLRLLEKQAS